MDGEGRETHHDCPLMFASKSSFIPLTRLLNRPGYYHFYLISSLTLMGIFFALVIGQCGSNACQNGGTCVGDVCKCRAEFSGEHCEIGEIILIY